MRRVQKVASIILSTAAGTGLVALYLIKSTVDTINSIVDTKCELRRKRSEYIYIDTLEPPTFPTDDDTLQWDAMNEGFPLTAWLERRINRIPRRILELIADSASFQERRSWIKRLLTFKPLYDWDYRTLSQTCDAQTAVALARTKEVNRAIFVRPRVTAVTKDKLIHKMHDLLVELKKRKKHWCLSYFINKAFPSYKSFAFLADLELRHGMHPLRIDDDNILPLCVESLLHHCLVRDYVRDLIQIGGLATLMNAYYFLSDDPDVTYNLAKIIFQVSNYPEYLNDLYVTGWISVLAYWSQSTDDVLAVLATTALANLDNLSEVSQSFKHDVLLLCPRHSSDTLPEVDVVVIHGIMGGAMTTWRSRSTENAMENEGLRSRDLVKKIIKEQGHDSDIEDFLVVLEDIPVNAPFDLPSEALCWTSNGECLNTCSTTECWPKDWLPLDCPPLRILGINYESRFTDWFSWCPLTEASAKFNLESKAALLMDRLIECDVGVRPVVFVCHSMGGLLVKHMLVRSVANPDFQQFFLNTKSVIFLSTPHFGSPLASLNRFLLLPSIELEELKHNSPSLVKLHEKFSAIACGSHLEVINFIEGSDTKVSALPLRLRCVPPLSLSDPAFGVTFEIPVGHTEIAKLGSRRSFIYQTILKSIQRASENS